MSEEQINPEDSEKQIAPEQSSDDALTPPESQKPEGGEQSQDQLAEFRQRYGLHGIKGNTPEELLENVAQSYVNARSELGRLGNEVGVYRRMQMQSPQTPQTGQEPPPSDEQFWDKPEEFIDRRFSALEQRLTQQIPQMFNNAMEVREMAGYIQANPDVKQRAPEIDAVMFRNNWALTTGNLMHAHAIVKGDAVDPYLQSFQNVHAAGFQQGQQHADQQHRAKVNVGASTPRRKPEATKITTDMPLQKRLELLKEMGLA